MDIAISMGGFCLSAPSSIGLAGVLLAAVDHHGGRFLRRGAGEALAKYGRRRF